MVVETTEAEALLVSLERVLQYVQLPQEEFDLLTDGSLGTAAAQPLQATKPCSIPATGMAVARLNFGNSFALSARFAGSIR